jgi:hypothetical protein
MPIYARDPAPGLSHLNKIEDLMQQGIKAHIVGFGLRENHPFESQCEEDVTIPSSEAEMDRNDSDSCASGSRVRVYSKLMDSSWRVFGVVLRGKRCDSRPQDE